MRCTVGKRTMDVAAAELPQRQQAAIYRYNSLQTKETSMVHHHLHTQWTNVDQAADPLAFAQALDATRSCVEASARYASLIAALSLQADASVLDVGCGTGGAVCAVAQHIGPTGHAVGIDTSATLIALAKERAQQQQCPATFQVADAYHLPFADATFDACMTIVTLEVLTDPAQAFHEMVRVTRTGGRLLVIVEDVDALAIAATDRDVTRRLMRHIGDRELHGGIGRQMPGLFVQLGLLQPQIRTMPRVSLTCSTAFTQIFAGFLTRAANTGTLTALEAVAWLRDVIERSQQGQFYACQMYLCITALKP